MNNHKDTFQSEIKSQYLQVLVGIVLVIAFVVGTSISSELANTALGFTALGVAAVWLFAGFTRLEVLVLVLILLAPFHSVVRGLDEQSVALSGWRDILFAGTFVTWVLWLGVGRLKVPKGYVFVAMVLFNLLGIFQAFRVDSWILAISCFRDVFKYSIIAIVVQSLCLRNPDYLRRIAVCIFTSCIFVSIIQLVYYTTDQDFIVRMGINPPTTRTLAGFTFRRMEAFFGGGPSNLGIYLASAFAIYLAYRVSREKVPVWWNIGAAILVISIALTVSFTGVVGVFGATALMLARRGTKSIYWISIIVAFGFLFTAMNLGFGDEKLAVDESETPDFFAYLTGMFYRELFLGYAGQTLSDPDVFLFGQGLGIVGSKSFLDENINSNVRILGNSDGGWAEYALQIGVPMTIFIVFTIIYIMWKSITTIKYLPKNLKSSAWALLGSCIAMMTSIHIVPWIRVGSDVNLWVVLGALSSIAAWDDKNQKNANTTRINE